MCIGGVWVGEIGAAFYGARLAALGLGLVLSRTLWVIKGSRQVKKGVGRAPEPQY